MKILLALSLLLNSFSILWITLVESGNRELSFKSISAEKFLGIDDKGEFALIGRSNNAENESGFIYLYNKDKNAIFVVTESVLALSGNEPNVMQDNIYNKISEYPFNIVTTDKAASMTMNGADGSVIKIVSGMFTKEDPLGLFSPSVRLKNREKSTIITSADVFKK